jgi:methylenetetrahydrofolate reductase (NADPH)
MMHLTCTNMKVEDVKAALIKARAAGIRNILALRGDPPLGVEVWEKCENGLSYAVDLVKLIRAEHGDYFGIAVAGYPEAHVEAESLAADVQRLKEKLDAGADFVVTQLFYDVELFGKWVQMCRDAGITAPIVPGIMPIQSYAGFHRMTGFCKTFVPESIKAALEGIKDDDAAVKAYGVELAADMSRALLEQGSPGLHFYTLNLEKSVTDILETLGFLAPRAVPLPWKQSQLLQRRAESVRPIFWANRPGSYLHRTQAWDEFPNGRWGDAASPAFGDLADYHLCPMRAGAPAERRRLWGEADAVTDVKAVQTVFEGYLSGSVSRLPWSETPLSSETDALREPLAALTRAGCLPINSQPRVHGADSADPVVGWGGPGGVVYQKAYIEFFAPPAVMRKVLAAAETHPSLRVLALDRAGNRESTYGADERVTAVTWGVFPGQQVLQPTVVDNDAFVCWKDEAFALWRSQWQTLYPEDSQAWAVLQEIQDSYWLVNVVDNDFVNGDIFKALEAVLEDK